jgi:hypothetical protein
MDERRKQAFEFARDTTKQLITLATGIIALTVTFSKEVFGTPCPFQLLLLVASWVFFLFSVVMGMWTLLALTGSLEPVRKLMVETDVATEEPSIRGSNVTIPSIVQILTFLIGLLLTVLFGITSL